MEQLNPGLPVYNEAEAVRLLGELNANAMERALNVIVARHEALRTTIQLTGDEPVAVVHESWPLRIRKIDLSGMETSARHEALNRLLVDEPRRLYNLETEPGIRATLLRLGTREHVFILMAHHIICDGSSEGILWRELATLYRSFLRDEVPVLPLLTIQYGDYAAWQVQRNTETSFAGDLAFSEQNLRGASQLLELPADRRRPPTLSYRGARRGFLLGSDVTKALRDLGRRAETTQFTVFAAAFSTLLYRYTGRDDIVLGIPIADRDREELQSLIGLLLHTHVLRTELSGDMTFRELLARVQKVAQGVFLHRQAPFDQVVRKLRPERNPSYSPLFQVMLDWRDCDQVPSSIGLEGLTVESVPVESGTSKFDLTLFATDRGDEIRLEMEYSTDLFDEGRIVRMLGHYKTLLESVAADPGRNIAGLPLLTPAEAQQQVEWNQTEIAWPKDRMLHELVEDQVERTPDAVAAVFESQHLTYRQLNDRANLLAHHLRNLGVGPNVLVGICVERSLEMLVGLLGILKAGGAYVPLDPAYPSDRLAFMLEDCRPLVLLTQKKLQKRLSPHQAQIICLDAAVAEKESKEGRRLPPNTCQSGDLAYVLYTSGSTGKPKGVRISNRALVNFLCAMQREPGLDAGDTLLAVTTLSFDIAGLELFLPLISGARVVIAGREVAADGARLSSLLARSGATVMQATPATWRILLAAGWAGSPELKILCGGEAWPADLGDELSPRCKSLWNMYGPTETTIWSSVARVEAGKPVVIGYPIANTTFYILDASRELVPVGVPGELYIGGEGVAEGYLNRPDLTNERFVSDPFGRKPGATLYRTGDVVRRLSDGRIEFLHRIDQQVKIRGFRIELEEVEAALKQHPAVAQCVALVREDLPGGKRLVAYTVPFDPHVVPHGAELRNFLKQKLPDYMIPSAFVPLEELPLTPNGKIDRNALPVPGMSLTERSPARQILPPRTPLEFELVRIWEQILGVKIASVRDSFFELGGHSLLAVQMFAQIEKVFKVRLPLATLYEAPAIEDIARILNREVIASHWSSLVEIQPSGSRPPFFCFHGEGGNVLIYRKLAEYLGSDQPFYGLQCQGLDGSSPLPKTIEEMSALYVKEIRSVQPHGPYLLGGYCLGGTIAYEAAQQLRAAGEEVALLALFDTMNWHKVLLTSWNRGYMLFQRLIFHAAVVLRIDSENKRKFLKGKFHDLRKRIPVWRGMLQTMLKRSSPGGTPSSRVLAQVWQANHRASGNYVPRPYAGPVTDFRPAKQYRAFDRPDLKWDGLAIGGLRVVVVPGYPAVMLLEPYVKDLAGTLATCIDDAIRRSKSSRPVRSRAAAQHPGA
jgi:surfactin family lipopeptide synthetase A